MEVFQKIWSAIVPTIRTCVLLVYLLFLRIYATVLPLLAPILSIFQSLPKEGVTVCEVIEHATKTVLMTMMLWLRPVVVVMEIMILPFDKMLNAFKQFLWELEYEMNTKPRTELTREMWLKEELKAEKRRRSKSDQESMEKTEGEETNKDGY